MDRPHCQQRKRSRSRDSSRGSPSSASSSDVSSDASSAGGSLGALEDVDVEPPTVGDSPAQQTSTNMRSVFLLFRRLTDAPFQLTPFIVYQILRGESFPQKVVMVRASSAGEQALVQLLSHEELLRVERRMNGVVVRLVGAGGAPAAAYRLEVRRSREPKVFAVRNNETSLVLAPQCVHLMGPIFERSWEQEGPRPAPMAAPRVPPVAPQHRNVQVGYSGGEVGERQPPGPSKAQLPAAPGAGRTRRYVPPKPPTIEQQACAADTSAPSEPPLPPNWTTAIHPQYNAVFFVYTDPNTGQKRSSWHPPAG